MPCNNDTEHQSQKDFSQHKIIIISGFSGAGKGSVIHELLTQSPGKYELIKSYTSRKKRSDDDYYVFVPSKAEFEDLIANGKFLEVGTYSGEYYATPAFDVIQAIERGKIPIIEVNHAGYRGILQSNTLKHYKCRIFSFFIAATASDLYDRLRKRNTEKLPDVIKRLKASLGECDTITDYDYIMINRDISDVRRNLESIIENQSTFHAVEQFDVEEFKIQLTETIRTIEKGLLALLSVPNNTG